MTWISLWLDSFFWNSGIVSFVFLLRLFGNRRWWKFGLFVHKSFVCIYWVLFVFNLVLIFKAFIFGFQVDTCSWFFRDFSIFFFLDLFFKILTIIVKVLFIVLLLFLLNFTLWFGFSLGILGNFASVFRGWDLLYFLIILLFVTVFFGLIFQVLFRLFLWHNLLNIFNLLILVAFFFMLFAIFWRRTFNFLDILIDFLIIIVNILRLFLGFIFAVFIIWGLNGFFVDDRQFGCLASWFLI